MQTRKGSLAETVVSTVIGYCVSFGAQAVIYPLFDIHVTHGQNAQITALFTLVSLVRGYFVRRLFNRLHGKGKKNV